jgi:acyl-CoA thioester hydrolase
MSDADLLADFPVIITLPVQWGDMDAFGHVNNTVPIRWFESARIAYLERVGLSDMMETGGIGPILAAISCNYRKQVNYPDTVQIGAAVGRIGRSSFTMRHAAHSQTNGWICVEGESTIVVFDYRAQRPTRVPEEIRQAVTKLEGKEFGDNSSS